MTVALSNISIQWTDAGTNYTSIGVNVSSTAYGTDSNLIRLRKDGNDLFVVDSSGNVGIGTSNPMSNLDVIGTANISGALTLGTDLAIDYGGTGASDAANARINILASSYSLGNIRIFSSGTNATYIPTSNTRAIYVEMVGGGAGGGSANGTSVSSGVGSRGGSGGSYAASFITNMNQTFKYTVGAGGTGGANTGAGLNDGANGGISYFYGGVSGTTVLVSADGGTGGVAYAGTTTDLLSLTGGVSGIASTVGDFIVRGGISGGRMGGTWNSLMSGGAGGSSMFGPGGLPSQASTGVDNGNAGYAYGSGGSGGAVRNSTDNASGGDGATGVIKIWEYF